MVPEQELPQRHDRLEFPPPRDQDPHTPHLVTLTALDGPPRSPLRGEAYGEPGIHDSFHEPREAEAPVGGEPDVGPAPPELGNPTVHVTEVSDTVIPAEPEHRSQVLLAAYDEVGVDIGEVV